MAKKQVAIFEDIYKKLNVEQRNWSSCDDIDFRETLLAEFIKQKQLVILGCGDFSLGERLLRHTDLITGIDFSEAAVNLARMKNLPQEVELEVADLSEELVFHKKYDVVIDDYLSHCITSGRTQFFSNVKSLMNSEALYIGLSVCWPSDYIWPDYVRPSLHPETHTQDLDGVAHRYFGNPADLESELILNGFQLLFKKVILNTYGQPIFFSISTKT